MILLKLVAWKGKQVFKLDFIYFCDASWLRIWKPTMILLVCVVCSKEVKKKPIRNILFIFSQCGLKISNWTLHSNIYFA